MKSTFKYFSAAFILVTILSSFVNAPAKHKTEVVSIQTSAICESCKARIERALKSTDGIISANLDLKDKKVKVKYDAGKTTADQIRKVIAGTGYDADNVKSNPEAYNNLPKCCQKSGGACEKK